jgi:hypothetical protein
MSDDLAEIKMRWGTIGLATKPHGPEWWIDRAGEDIARLVAELERLRDRLAWYEEEKATCRVCGEPISKMSSQWWHDETTKDHEAQPSAPAAELGR